MTTVLDALNSALHSALYEDPNVYIIGEDILDPYGGAFKVTRGLSTQFPERVLSSPISEAGIVGLAGGMALRGLRPVVEIMFGDFITLIADQIINSITKFHWMYNQQVELPMVIRTPMGGRRGYGPTHSQTLDKLFLGVPGLHVVAPTVLGNPGELLKQAILKDNQPVLFIENKLQYLQKCFDTSLSLDFDLVSSTLPNAYTSIYTLSVKDAPPPSLTLTTYGYMSNLAKQAVLHLAYEYEIFCDLIVPTQLVPFKTQDSLPIQLIESLKRTNRLLTVEENSFTLGWGAEIIARAAQIFGPTLKAVQRLAAVETPIPASPPLEDLTFPNVDDIVQTARMMV